MNLEITKGEFLTSPKLIHSILDHPQKKENTDLATKTTDQGSPTPMLKISMPLNLI